MDQSPLVARRPQGIGASVDFADSSFSIASTHAAVQPIARTPLPRVSGQHPVDQPSSAPHDLTRHLDEAAQYVANSIRNRVRLSARCISRCASGGSRSDDDGVPQFCGPDSCGPGFCGRNPCGPGLMRFPVSLLTPITLFIINEKLKAAGRTGSRKLSPSKLIIRIVNRQISQAAQPRVRLGLVMLRRGIC